MDRGARMLLGGGVTQRLFIAIALPEVHRDVLSRLREDTWKEGWNWTPRRQLHLTLRFLGEVEDGPLIERLEDGLATQVGAAVQPFVLPLGGVGVFPPRGQPKVLWVGVGAGHPRLYQLRQRMDDLLLSLGLDVDLRRFMPHVTVARLRDTVAPTAVNHFLKKQRGFEGPPFRVSEFGLYASELSAAGAEHTLVRSFPLGEGLVA